MYCLVKGNFQDTSWQLEYMGLAIFFFKKKKLVFYTIMKENEWRILYKWHSYDIMRHLKKVKNSLLENLFSHYTLHHPCLPFYGDCMYRWKVNLIFKKICFSLFRRSTLTSHFNSFFKTLGVSYWLLTIKIA